MEINMKKTYLSHILIFFIMLLFAASLTINVFFCGNYNPFELINTTAVTETRAISEHMVPDEDDGDTTYFKTTFLNENNSHTKTITKNICPTPIITAIPKEFCLLLFLTIVFLYFFSTLFRLLPDEWTLINQKVRLDD